MATCRPVAWSACSAITAATASSVAAVNDTPAAAQPSAKPGPAAHDRSANNHPSRLVHRAARGHPSPARTTQPRHFAERSTAPTRAKTSRFAHPLRAASSRD